MFTGPHCFLLTFPLLLLVIPFSGEALHWTDSHVQHLLELFLFVLGVKCVWHRAKHCKQSNAYFRRHDKLAPDFEVFMSNRIAPIGPILKRQQLTKFPLPEHNYSRKAQKEQAACKHSLPLS